MNFALPTRFARLAVVSLALSMFSLSLTSCSPKSTVGPDNHITPEQAAAVAAQLGSGIGTGNPLLFAAGMFGAGRPANVQGRLGRHGDQRPRAAVPVGVPGL